ncbi:MAG TPA: YafY family protein [Cytophagaceae bacterium]|nr:YafY family protein [Cytophagaceae bacterium]
MNRIDRVTAILIQLQSSKVVKAQDIADRFGISLRTVYRDIRTLEEAGVPLLGEAGVGYSIMEGYRLPPVMFTMQEATAFLTAEKLVEKMTDTSTLEHYKSAMYKVRAVLRSSEKEFLETADQHIQVVRRQTLSIISDDLIQTILKGIAEKKVLKMQYLAKYSEENTLRLVEPVGISFISNRWHLIAYCQLRQDYRDFRIDRIKSLSSTDTIVKNEHPSLEKYLQDVAEKQDLHKVVVQVEKHAAKYIEEPKLFYGFVSERELGDEKEMTFLVPSLEGFARWYMEYADSAKVISPPELGAKVKEMAAAILGKL